MKNGFGLIFSILLLIALGCSCLSKLAELGKKKETTPPPPASTPYSPSSTPAKTGQYDVSMEKYEQVKIGMKRSDVENIFGGKGEEYYSGTGGGVSFTSVKWVGDKYKTVLVSFRNEKVTSKSQVGLNK